MLDWGLIREHMVTSIAVDLSTNHYLGENNYDYFTTPVGTERKKWEIVGERDGEME